MSVTLSFYAIFQFGFCFPVVPGPVLSLSTQCVRDCEQVKLLVLCAGQKEHNQSGSLLTVLSLPPRGLAGILQTHAFLHNLL